MRSPRCLIGWHSPYLQYAHSVGFEDTTLDVTTTLISVTCPRCGKPQPTPKGKP